MKYGVSEMVFGTRGFLEGVAMSERYLLSVDGNSVQDLRQRGVVFLSLVWIRLRRGQAGYEVVNYPSATVVPSGRFDDITLDPVRALVVVDNTDEYGVRHITVMCLVSPEGVVYS